MSISYNGYNSSTLTFEAGSGLTAGAPVTLNSDGQAVCASADDYFIGVCTAVREGWASVQTDGYVEVKYSGTAPSKGVGALVTGANKTVAKGGEGDVALYKILNVDTTNSIVGFIL